MSANPPISKPHESPWLIVAAGIVIVLAAIAAYQNSLSGPFVFDDSSSVTDNPSIRQLWPLRTVFMPPPEYTTAGRPLANLSFALNYALGGLSVGAYRLVNLALHIWAALLLFGITRRTLRFAVGAGGSVRNMGHRWASNALPLAVVTAVLWAVHPLLTGTVSYVSQRTEIMMAAFYLLTLYAFVRGVEGQSRVWLAVSVVACFAGVASKEVMATAPLLVALYDCAFVGGSFSAAWRQRGKYYVALASSWLLLGFLMTGLERRAVGFGLGVSWWDYALTECRAVASYLGLTVWPFPLVFDRGQSFLNSSLQALGWAAVLGGLVGGATILWMRWRPAGFLAVAFFLILAPTSSVVPVAAQPMAENRVYLPAAFAIALGVAGLFAALGKKAWFAFATAGIALGWSAVQRNTVHQDKIALWTDTVAKAPLNARAHENLGEAYSEIGNHAEARRHLETAVRLQSDYPEAHNNLGVVVQHLGDLAGARTHFEAALRLRPRFATAHDHLGNLLMQSGRVAEAQQHFQAALEIRPDYFPALNNLGNALLFQGKVAEAQARYQEALRIRPGFAQAHLNLGVTLRQQGQMLASKQCFETAVRLDPKLPEARLALGVALLEEGRVLPAQAEFEAALSLRPGFPEAHNNLGNALIREGKFSAARQHFEEALRLRPGYRDAEETLARLKSAAVP